MESNIKQINKKIINRMKIMIFFIIIISSIIIFNTFFVNKDRFEKINYKNIINLYVLNDGTLRVEENIKLDKNEYSTYFLVSDRFDEIDYDENVENLKVYYNDIELDTDKDNKNGYFLYKRNQNIVESKQVELRFSRYDNIEIYLPDYESNLKIVYDLKDYIANYNDISYFQFNLQHGINLFQNDVRINIIMPESTDVFDIYNNKKFTNKYIIKDINSSRKELYFTGLENEKLHIEVILNKDIVDSNLKLNEDGELKIKEKHNKDLKDKLKLYIVLFFLLIGASIILSISNTVKFWNRENMDKVSFDERNNVKFYYFKILFVLMIFILIFYIIIK